MREQWLKSALLGVQSPLRFSGEGPLTRLLDSLHSVEDPALALSRSVGAIAACALAGVTTDALDSPLPEPAAEDPRVLASGHHWAAAIAEIFAANEIGSPVEARLRHEVCRCVEEHGTTLPVSVLPMALVAGQRNVALRVALLPVLGTRGRWLAARNPQWRYATALDGDVMAAGQQESTHWSQGSQADRLLFLTNLRSHDPAAARDLLAAGIGELSAKERAELIPLLNPQLGADDIGLLTSLLRDRSREVRSIAASLLARLPDSEHAQRLIAWMAPLVNSRRGLIGKSWSCEAPETADPQWPHAAIEVARPQHEALGERAWWLYQLARQVPLRWWEQHTGMDPSQLVGWAWKSDWKSALIRGWFDRVGANDGTWIAALLEWKGPELRSKTAALLALLPIGQRERHWPADVAELNAKGLLADVIGAFAPGEHLSLDFSRRLYPSLVECFADDRLRHDYVLRPLVLELLTLLHPSCLSPARSLPRSAEETPAMTECADAFERIVSIRRSLHAEP